MVAVGNSMQMKSIGMNKFQDLGSQYVAKINGKTGQVLPSLPVWGGK